MSSPSPWSEEFYTDEIQHYGVIGMKWGVRKLDPKTGIRRKVSHETFNKDRDDYRNAKARSFATSQAAKNLTKKYGKNKLLTSAVNRAGQQDAEKLQRKKEDVRASYGRSGERKLGRGPGGLLSAGILGGVVSGVRDVKDLESRVTPKMVEQRTKEIEKLYKQEQKKS